MTPTFDALVTQLRATFAAELAAQQATIDQLQATWPVAGGDPAKQIRALCAAAVTRNLAAYPDADPAGQYTARTGQPAPHADQVTSRVCRAAFVNAAWRAFRHRFDVPEYRLLPLQVLKTPDPTDPQGRNAVQRFFDELAIPPTVLGDALVRLAIRRRIRHWRQTGAMPPTDPGLTARVVAALIRQVAACDLTTEAGRRQAVRRIQRAPVPIGRRIA